MDQMKSTYDVVGNPSFSPPRAVWLVPIVHQEVWQHSFKARLRDTISICYTLQKLACQRLVCSSICIEEFDLLEQIAQDIAIHVRLHVLGHTRCTKAWRADRLKDHQRRIPKAQGTLRFNSRDVNTAEHTSCKLELGVTTAEANCEQMISLILVDADAL